MPLRMLGKSIPPFYCCFFLMKWKFKLFEFLSLFFAKFAIFLLLMVENHAIEYFFNARVKGKGKRKIIGF